jgi:hypothetical protein
VASRFNETRAGHLDRRVIFYQRALDANQSRLGALTAVVTRDARVQPLRGGETVMEQRMQGEQPVIISVRRDAVTRTIDNSFKAEDARDETVTWDVKGATVTEDLVWVDILAVQRVGQPLE